MTDLPLTIKEHPRARNVLVKLVPGRGLEVVVPKGFDRGRVPEVLARKQGWILRTRARMEREGILLAPSLDLPESLEFLALGVTRTVNLVHRAGKIVLRENAGNLLLAGDMDQREEAIAALRKYVAAQARQHLPPLLAATAQRLGLDYAGTRIRTQKTRWGSCSARGTISLNAKLLFLPPQLVEQLFVHELCHRRHLNHSPAFWNLVASFQPDYARLEDELKNGSRHVPAWIL
ncbi:M48 family metallopeptidase [Salidesulfovibrio onnuriiensis]|uniref:M48 family metallopeptidase n=1 Tax=Salidesulfovibrio onnuriiensis TaxID=2583823 RepID=UPI0011C787CE|nr:SprT family zinc-dependent metalloprotease [Salidesulfovibrio onnuriiensis]